MKRLSIIAILFGLILPCELVAHEVPHIINFTHTPDQTLDKTWMIAQDSNRFMYFGHTTGLLSYDGSFWNSLSLPDKQIVRSIAIDAAGHVFSGGYGEFGYWKRNQESQWTYHSLSKEVDFELAHKEEIWHILVRPDYVLFQSFSTIYLYDYKKIRVIRPPGDLRIMFTHDVRDRNFLQVKERGVFELKSDGSFSMLPGSEKLANMEVVCLLPYSQEGLLIGTSLNGIFIWENDQLKKWETPLNDLFVDNQLNKGLRLSDHTYALGTILNGLYILNEDGSLKYHLNREWGLQNNTILSMYEDQAQNLWLGLDKGIDLIELNTQLVFYPDVDGFLGTVYDAVVFDEQLWVGTNHGVYMRPWNKDQQAAFSFLAGSQGQVWDLNVFEGQLLCGHNEGSFSIENGRWEKISEVTGGWNSILYPGRNDRIIQATYTGLIILKKDESNKWVYSHRLEGLRDPIRKIMFDQEGYLWALNPYKGLYRLRVDPDQVDILEMRKMTPADGLPSEFNLEMTGISGEIYIRSGNGFYAFDIENYQFYQIHAIEGHDLPEGDYSLISGKEDVWFMAFPNLVRLIDGDLQEEFDVPLVYNYANIVALDSQYYLFGLNAGYALYNYSERAITREDEFGPVITQVCLMGKQDTSACFSPLVSNGQFVKLKHDQNYLRFSFTDPVYTHNPRFRYKLEGFDRDYAGLGEEHFKEFSNLNPGTYTFHIESQRSGKSASFRFEILPAWYQTVWARLLFVFAVLGMILLLGRYLAHMMEMRRRKKERERQQELQRQLIQARNEKLQLEVLNKSQELANTTMSLVRKNEILLDLKEEMKNIRSELNQGLPYKYYRRILRLIDGSISNEHDWKVFETNFNQVHEQFFKRLKADYPDLTPGDLQLAAFLRMNLSSKEIAPLLNISLRGVENKRYRLRKKMGLAPEDNLTGVLIEY